MAPLSNGLWKTVSPQPTHILSVSLGHTSNWTRAATFHHVRPMVPTLLAPRLAISLPVPSRDTLCLKLCRFFTPGAFCSGFFFGQKSCFQERIVWYGSQIILAPEELL